MGYFNIVYLHFYTYLLIYDTILKRNIYYIYKTESMNTSDESITSFEYICIYANKAFIYSSLYNYNI